MPTERFWVLSFAFALGCGGSEDPPIATGGSGPGPSGGSGGSAPSSGAGGAPASGGTTGGLSSAGAPGGSSSSNGGSSAGMSTSGGAGAGASSGAAGTPSGGAATGGSGGKAATGGSGGKVATGGSGGKAGCVQNLGCKLSPPPSTGDIHQDCVDRINQFRTQCACLPPLARRTDGEACANQMAEYDAGKNSAHAGARDNICQPGGAQNECPGYSSNNQVIGLCMQQMWDEGPPPMTPCTDACFQEYGHFINMTSTSSTKVACGFYTTSAGKVWAVQNFSR